MRRTHLARKESFYKKCASVKRKNLEEEEVLKSLKTQISDLISQTAARTERSQRNEADSFKQTVSAKKEVIEELERSIVKLNTEVKDCGN